MGTIAKLSIADVVDPPSNADEVRQGAVIKAVYAEVWASSDDATQSIGIFSIEKQVNAGGQIYADSLALNAYTNKKNVFETHEGLLNPQLGVCIPVFKGWIKIPKGKQRFGLGDKLVLNVSAVTDGAQICGLFIYKEYF